MIKEMRLAKASVLGKRAARKEIATGKPQPPAFNTECMSLLGHGFGDAVEILEMFAKSRDNERERLTNNLLSGE